MVPHRVRAHPQRRGHLRGRVPREHVGRTGLPAEQCAKSTALAHRRARPVEDHQRSADRVGQIRHHPPRERREGRRRVEELWVGTGNGGHVPPYARREDGRAGSVAWTWTVRSGAPLPHRGMDGPPAVLSRSRRQARRGWSSLSVGGRASRPDAASPRSSTTGVAHASSGAPLHVSSSAAPRSRDAPPRVLPRPRHVLAPTGVRSAERRGRRVARRAPYGPPSRSAGLHPDGLCALRPARGATRRRSERSMRDRG